jgi:hypothetical protein
VQQAAALLSHSCRLALTREHQTSNKLHNDMLSKWVNVLLPYDHTVLAEQQDAQAALDDEKAKVTSIKTVAYVY